MRLPASDAESADRLEAGEDDEGKGRPPFKVVVKAPVKCEEHRVQDDTKEKGKSGLGCRV